MTARVSYAHRARAPAAAVAWIAAFAVAGTAAGYALTLVPLHATPRWALAWSSLPWAAGFGLATWLVGRVLERRTWHDLGWRPRTGIPLALLAGMAHHPAAALMPAVLSGALLGYLVYNRHPARIFMGDTGSLGLGTAMVAAAVAGGLLWYLPILAIVFVAETVSVIVQVAGFKATGRRLLKMSPLHHHFHLSGWSENRVAVSFWAVTLAAALLTLAIARPPSPA